MSQSKILADRLREVMLNGTWIARTNVKDQVSTLDLSVATKKIGNLNSIALLTFHLNYYIEGIIHYLKGGELTIRDKFSFDMPELNSESKWEELKSRTWNNAEELASLIENLDEKTLHSFFVKEEYGTYQRNIEAQIEHGYYHLGQITLIRKMLTENT